MTPENRRRVEKTIACCNLHESVPVNLWKLESVFPLRYDDIAPLLGAIMPPKGGWPVAPGNRAKVVIDSSLPRYVARWVYAHEIGHGLCRHAGHLNSLMLDRIDKDEREAWEVAAHLLIPMKIIMEEKDIEYIAYTCDVPEWLVELRWRS